MNSDELTKRQRQVLQYIQDFVLLHGFPPTVRDISHRFRIQINSAVGHLAALERKGRIVRTKMVARGIRVLRGAGQ